MWSSSVCLKLMLLLPKELWTWGNLHRYSDQIKTTTVFLLLCDKYCVWSCVLTYSGCWTEMLLPQWLYMKGHTWTNPYLSPRVCVHASCIELEEYFYFYFFSSVLLLGYLDGGDCMTSVCSFVWKWSPVHCTVTGLLKHFNIFVFVWKKRLEQKHSDSEQTLVHRQAMMFYVMNMF